MDYDLILLLETVKKRTGKNVCVFSEIDDSFYATEEGLLPDRPEYKVSGVVPDEFRHKTFFRFRHKAESLVGYIDGTGENERINASLITLLLENGVIKERINTKKEAINAILLGEENGIGIQKYMDKFSVSDRPCTVYVVSAKKERITDVVNFLENFKSDYADIIAVTDESSCAYVRFLGDGIGDEYQSVADFGYLLEQSIKEELNLQVKIGIGTTVQGFRDCAVSYQQAVAAARMGGVFDANSSVFTYKEYIMIKIIEDLPKFKMQEYLEILSEPETKNILSDADMIETAEEFLRTSLNISETARNLYMHRNTLMYRLDKISRETGLDIRKFQDAVTFRLILILYKLLGYKLN